MTSLDVDGIDVVVLYAIRRFAGLAGGGGSEFMFRFVGPCSVCVPECCASRCEEKGEPGSTCFKKSTLVFI